MRKKIVALILSSILITICSSTVSAKDCKEAFYITEWCTANGGVEEVRMPDRTRADCMTDRWAVELGFADSAWEDTAQARNYAKWTGKQPMVVIIVEDPKYSLKYLQRRLNTSHPDVLYQIWDVGGLCPQ